MRSVAEIEARVKEVRPVVERIQTQVRKLIVGQQAMMDRLLIALLTNGHVLLEGVPGLAKTTAVHTLARSMALGFKRIQFTPDLLPADLIGTQIYNPREGSFTTHRGPVFAHILLADEINRAPAKVQSALLEAMQERQVTIGSETFYLEEPFLVLATQNPIEQEGTYPLPEAQMDRFLLKVKIGYPNMSEEREIVRRNLNDERRAARPIVSPSALLRARDVLQHVYMDEKIEQYLLDLVFATRTPADYSLRELSPLIRYGASPRASIALAQSARAMAFLKRRGFVIPEDVRAVAPDVLRHRIGLSYEAEAENVDTEEIIARVLAKVEVP